MDYRLHERLFRGERLLERMKDFPVTICGAGALGANIAESLVRMGFGTIRVIDRDRIEEHNLSTQPWGRDEIGAQKATMLANELYRATGTEVEGVARELTPENAGSLLKGSGLVVDAFDNSVARRSVAESCAERQIPCLHCGLARDYAEIIWNEGYRVPSSANDDVCEYPLARNLVMMTVAVGCETIVRFVGSGLQESRTITFGDFAVKEYKR